MQSPDSWSVLTEAELIELGDIAQRWLVAHLTQDFAVADRLRSELMEWGAWPIEHGWHPVFESQGHRYARIMRREDSRA